MKLDARINQARARVAAAERNLEMAHLNLKRIVIQAEAAGRDQSGLDAVVQK